MFEPDPETKEMTVVSIHPGVTREQIQENTGWKVRFAAKVAETPAPTRERTRSAARIARAHQRAPTARRRDGNARRFPLRRRAHADRPLWRRAGQGAHRRSRRGADQGADGAQSEGRLGKARRGLFRLRQPGRRGQPQRRAHGAAAGRPAGERAGRDAQPALRLRASMRSAPRRARSAPARWNSPLPAASNR